MATHSVRIKTGYSYIHMYTLNVATHSVHITMGYLYIHMYTLNVATHSVLEQDVRIYILCIHSMWLHIYSVRIKTGYSYVRMCV